jgi:hypothetical protein
VIRRAAALPVSAYCLPNSFPNALRESIGATLPPDGHPAYERTLAATRAQLDEATFAAAWEAGRALSLEQAIAYALEVGAMDAEQPAPALATAKQSG